MRKYFRAVAVGLFIMVGHTATAGELKKDYFDATKPGDWITQELTSPDGSRSTYVSKRLPDEDGRVVVELSVKVIKGPGEGSESKNVVHLPTDFNFARDWLSYGKFTEKMSMEYSGMVMPLDENTLKIMRDSSKDYRGAVNFVGTETMDGYDCDHYSYTLDATEANASKETGDLWLNDSVPFGIVRQSAKTTGPDAGAAYTYDIRMTDFGSEAVAEAPVEESPAVVAEPTVVSLLEGYTTEFFALDLEAVPGTKGRKLQLTLRNKTDGEVTVKLAAGKLDIPGSSPVSELLITIDQAVDVILPAGESSDPITVNQRGTYGPVEGKFTLSYYEGTAYFTGSVSLDKLAK